MIDASEIAKDWQVNEFGWSVSPGVAWCAEGNGVKLGDRVELGNWAVVEAGRALHDLGFADGYRKSIADVDGVAYIGAGCRWFTLSEALKHWGNHEEDRRATMCLMESAKALAKMYGLKTGE